MSAAESSCLSGSVPGLTVGQASIVLSNPAQLTPGLPVGFDPSTGLITDNTTGATDSRGDFASAFSALVPPVGPGGAPAAADFWSQYGSLVLAGAAILGGLALFAAVKR